MTPQAHYPIRGTWLIETSPLGESGILVIMDNERAIQFQTSETKPRMNRTMRLWYSNYNGHQIRFKPSPSAEGWLRGVQPAPIGWIMTDDKDGIHSRFSCLPLSSDDLPDWYEEMLLKNLTKMKQLEEDLKTS